MVKFYTIEGNIGSGKSTFVKHLKTYFKNYKSIIFLPEPVDEWLTIKDDKEDMLTKFYRDTKKYAFAFQMMAYISRLSIIKREIEKNPDVVLISERGVFTDRNVFAKMLYDDGLIEEVEYQIYNKWFNEFIKEIPLDGIIYIKTEPTKCMERIIKRNRSGETLTLDYLNKCHNYHNNWINSYDNVLNLNGDKDKDNYYDYVPWIQEFNKIIGISEPTVSFY